MSAKTRKAPPSKEHRPLQTIHVEGSIKPVHNRTVRSDVKFNSVHGIKGKVKTLLTIDAGDPEHIIHIPCTGYFPVPKNTSLSQRRVVAAKPRRLRKTTLCSQASSSQPSTMLAATFDRTPIMGNPSILKHASPTRHKPMNMQAANAKTRSKIKKQYEVAPC